MYSQRVVYDICIFMQITTVLQISFTNRFQGILLGPGLGKSESLVGRMAAILDRARGRDMAVVIDGDGLWYLQQRHTLLQVS